MRTTIRLDDQLLREVKKVAAESGRTLTAVIEDSLRLSLAKRHEARSLPPPDLPTHSGGGLQPGVDLENRSSLEDLMDGI